MPLLRGDSDDFMLGIEIGLLWSELGWYEEMAELYPGETIVLEDVYDIRNQEQILLMANRTGWSVKNLKTRKNKFKIRMEKEMK